MKGQTVFLFVFFSPVIAVSQVLTADVAEARSNLKCDAVPQADGSLMFQLSGISHFPPDCYSSSWADENVSVQPSA